VHGEDTTYAPETTLIPPKRGTLAMAPPTTKTHVKFIYKKVTRPH